MYKYSSMDLRFVKERVAEFRDQVRRRGAGELTEDEFRPLRLMNGLYMQRHAYMLRVAIPYGLISSAQMRAFGVVADRYDRGYGHFTTRQNLQYNWLKLEDVPDLLDLLADVEMNGIQTSGNCVRNITTDPYAGTAADEILDCRPYCEHLRQYVALHPEFMYLPRKFKIAFSGAAEDRAATAVHDIGIRAVREPNSGELTWRVFVGGGLGRTPRIAPVIRDYLPLDQLQSYVEAILRVYNLHGRRDNKFKARIKILVGALGVPEFQRQVEAEWETLRASEETQPDAHAQRMAALTEAFADIRYDSTAGQGPEDSSWRARAATDTTFRNWLERNVKPHRVPGYHSVLVSLKRPDIAPGDVFTAEFHALADLMDRFNQGQITAVYNQNLCLQNIRGRDLEAVYAALQALGMARANMGTIQDMICCPGLDFCSLANASSIPVAKALFERFADLDEAYDYGPVDIKMSGCINACGHHHVGDIGVLGIDKHGAEFFQVAIGGSPGTSDDDPASLAEVIGPSVPIDAVVDLVERIMDCYVDARTGREIFRDTVRRVGVDHFRDYLAGVAT